MARRSPLMKIFDGNKLVELGMSCCNATHDTPNTFEKEIFRIFGEYKSQKIRLDQYEQDSAELLEKHGVDPDDKVDREDLKRMLNYLIGKNRHLINENEELKEYKWMYEDLCR